MDGNRLGAYVASRREQLGKTQKELGLAAGISRARIGQIESGRITWPRPEVFNGLARGLEIPATMLLAKAGVELGGFQHEQLEWVISQLDDDGRDQLADIGRAILPRHLRRPETGAA